MAQTAASLIFGLPRRNPFMVGLLAVLVLAFLYPEFGSREGPIMAGKLSKLGVMIIFLLQGLSLRTRQLIGGFSNFRLHGFIQGWIFIFAATVLVATSFLLRKLGIPQLADGFLYLALVPTTISSAIAFTSAGEGNVPAAIFNTSFSNIVGVFWVPTGCLLLLSGGSGVESGLLLSLLLKLCRLILLPMAIGQILRPIFSERNWFRAITPRFKVVNHGIILFIVYSVLCDSLQAGAWQRMETGHIVLLLFLTAVCVVLIHAGVWISSKWLFADHADRVCILFCGSQKTLAAGAPMAVAIFTGSSLLASDVGTLILPLLCYHPMQLFLGALILARLEA